jgi:hypothetical protein
VTPTCEMDGLVIDRSSSEDAKSIAHVDRVAVESPGLCSGEGCDLARNGLEVRAEVSERRLVSQGESAAVVARMIKIAARIRPSVRWSRSSPDRHVKPSALLDSIGALQLLSDSCCPLIDVAPITIITGRTAAHLEE